MMHQKALRLPHSCWITNAPKKSQRFLWGHLYLKKKKKDGGGGEGVEEEEEEEELLNL